MVKHWGMFLKAAWLLPFSLIHALLLSRNLTPLWIASRLNSGRVSLLLRCLDYRKSYSGLVHMLKCKKTGFHREYSRNSAHWPELISEVCEAFAEHKSDYTNHSVRNLLLNNEVIHYTASYEPYPTSNTLENILKPLLDIKIKSFVPAETEAKAKEWTKLVSDAVDFIIYIINFARSDYQYHFVYEVLVRIMVILKVSLQNFPDEITECIRQLDFFGWAIESSILSSKLPVFQRITAFFCKVADVLGMEHEFCLNLEDIEEKLLDTEESFWEMAPPKVLETVGKVRAYQDFIYRRSTFLMLYTLAFPSRCTEARMGSLMDICGHGLFAEDALIYSIHLLHNDLSRTSLCWTIEAFLKNCLDIFHAFYEISAVYELPKDYWAARLAFHNSLLCRRGLMRHENLPHAFLFWREGELAPVSLGEAREIALDELLYYTNAFFSSGGENIGGAQRIGEYAILCIKLGMDISFWYNYVLSGYWQCLGSEVKTFARELIGEPLRDYIGADCFAEDQICGFIFNSPTKG